MAIVISTRPLEDALIDAEVLAQSDISCLPAPMMHITPLKLDMNALYDALDVDAVALTSRHSVQFIAGTKWADKPILCVGESTARLAREAGIDNVITGPGDGEGLVQMMTSSMAHHSIFWPSAVDVGFDLERPLAEHGITTHRYPVYKAALNDQLPEDVLTALRDGHVRVIMVHSGRAGAHLTKLLKQYDLSHIMKDIDIVAVSTRVAGHCGDGWRKLISASEPRRQAMFDAVIKIMNNNLDH